MLKQLLKSITESVSRAHPMPAPADPGPYLELLEPIAEGAGIDLTYEDEYAALQDQISKRGDIDDSVVLGNGTLLLRDRGKDLRVAVFMAYSSLRVDGMPAALHVLALISALIERFGEEVHPRKPAARRSALEWLCSERFIDPLTVLARVTPEATLLTLQQTVGGLVASVQGWPEGTRPDLSGLTQRIQGWLDESDRAALGDAVSHNAQPEPQLPPLLGAGSQADQNVNPKSSQEAWQLVRKSSAALRADPACAAQGVALMRVARWSAVTELPPHQGGTTRLPAPRPEARAYVEGLLSNAQWAALLDESARVFNEGSNHLWLDLVCWTDQASAQTGGELASARLAVDVRELLARVPLLPTLRFEDGSPFANAATQAWLQGLLSPPPAVAVTKSSASAVSPELPRAALAALKAKGVAAALALVQSELQGCTAQRDRHELQRLMLTLAQEGGRAELALGLARELCAQVDEFALARWEPSLAFDAWAALYRLLRSAGESSHAEGRGVYRRLCGLDAVRAAGFLA